MADESADEADYARSIAHAVQEALWDDPEWTRAGDALASSAESVVNWWLMDEGYEVPAAEKIFKMRRSPAQAAHLLLLLALSKINKAVTFQVALRINAGLDAGLSWEEMAKAVGRSRQALHRQYAHHVRTIQATSGQEDLVDLAYRLEAGEQSL